MKKFCLLVAAFSIYLLSFGSISNIDSLLKVCEKSNDTTKINIYNQIASEYIFTDPEKSLDYGKKAYDLSQEVSFNQGSANALKTMASVYNEIGNYTKAIEFAVKAEKLYSDLNNLYGKAKTYNLIGIINDNIDNSKKSIEYYEKALELFEKLKDKKGQAGTLNNIAIIHFKSNDYATAIQFIERALAIYTEVQNQRGISVCYNNMGNAYKSMKKYDIALSYYNKALEIKQKIGEPSGIGLTLINIGGIYMVKKDYTNALVYLNKSVEINKSISALSQLSDAYKSISETYAALSNYSKAYDYMVLHSEIVDSLHNKENIKKINELQLVYETEAKQNEIELLTQKDQVNSLKIEKQQLLRNILIASIFIIALVLSMLFTRYKRVKTTNKILEEQKQRIAKTNNELITLNETLTTQKKIVDELNAELNNTNIKLIESERNLIELNATKDKFFSIVSHDLKNPFASIISFSRIIKRGISDYSKEELQELANELDKSVNRINNLLENLLWWSRVQTGRINPNPDDICVADVIQENIDVMLPFAQEKNIIIDDQTDDEINVLSDWNMLATIVRNLLSNAIKYSLPNSTIQITSSTTDDNAMVSISDHGVGISPENLNRLFKIESGFTTFGTADEKGSGLGLIVCKELINIMDGTLEIKSEPEKGTIVTISIPLSI